MRTNPLHTFVLSALVAVSATSSGLTQQNTSEFTSIALTGCIKFQSVIVHGGEFATGHDCPGLPGYRVYRLNYDGRNTVGIGFNRLHASKQRAGQQMFPTFSEIADKMEWRIDPKTKRPVAAILRWTISDYQYYGKPDPPKNFDLLIVIRTPPGPSCHIAYIDAAENQSADELARKAADELALNFDCVKNTAHIIGNRGRGIELTKPLQ